MEQSSALPSRTSSLSFSVWLEPVLVGLVGFVLASAVAASDGGYFSDSWAWVALVSLVVATLRLILVPALPFRRLDWAFVLGLAAFAGWVALSVIWAPATTPTVNETIRDVSYAAVVFALLLITRRRSVEALLVGSLLGVTMISSYTLLTRLHPDWVGSWDPVNTFRLAGPIGYWNGLGLYAAMGTLLALGLVARSESRVVQALAAVAPVFLVPTMLFTFSRGAWLAFAVGLVAAVLLDPRRLQLGATALVLAPWPASVIGLATLSDLTKSTVTLQEAADEGGSLLVWIGVMAVASACSAVGFRLVNARVHVSPGAQRTVGFGALVGVTVAAAATFAVAGAPWTLAQRAADAFNATPTASGPNVTGRLLNLSSNGRVEQWRVSIDQFRDRPIVGEGAGSYAAAWDLRRSVEVAIQDSHSLYIEVLGELGLVGLVVLVAGLAIPLVAAWRARRRPLVVGAAATYSAFLAHAAIDWDWELAGVTLVALMAAVALVVSARGDDEDIAPRAATRFGLPVVTAVLAFLALAAVLSAVPLRRASTDYHQLQFAEAAAQAQKAFDWAPWSTEALDVRGRSELAQGQLQKARASFELAVAKDPNDWVLWRDLAAAAAPDRARLAVHIARDLNPLEAELVHMQEALAPKTP